MNERITFTDMPYAFMNNDISSFLDKGITEDGIEFTIPRDSTHWGKATREEAIDMFYCEKCESFHIQNKCPFTVNEDDETEIIEINTRDSIYKPDGSVTKVKK